MAKRVAVISFPGATKRDRACATRDFVRGEGADRYAGGATPEKGEAWPRNDGGNAFLRRRRRRSKTSGGGSGRAVSEKYNTAHRLSFVVPTQPGRRATGGVRALRFAASAALATWCQCDDRH